MYVQPVILPAVAQKTVEIIISLEPRLKVNRRSIIVRRIHQFILVRSEIDREIPYAAQISAPPVEIIIAVVRGVIIPVAGYVYWIYLGSLYHYQNVRILCQYPRRGSFCGVLPVVCGVGVVPYRRSAAFVGLSVRLVFQVVRNYRVVVLVSFG